MTTKPRVFLITPRENMEIGTAAKYGEVTYLFEDYAPSPFSTEEACRSFERALISAQFNPGVDYIALSGAIIQIGLLALVIGGMYNAVNLLLYNSSLKEYVHRQINLSRPTELAR